MMLTLPVALALHRLGMLSPTQMREYANDQLLAEEDTTTLRILAGLGDHDLGEAETLFMKLRVASGLPTPSLREAAILATRWIASEICAGDLNPYDGAREIWRIAQSVDDDNFHDLDPFIYAASEYQERPSDRQHFAAEIVSEARRWAER